MISHKLANLIQFFAPNTYNVIANRGKSSYSSELDKQKNADKELRIEAKLIEFERKYPIGGFVVSIPNEAVNPVIGRIVEHYDCGGKFSDPILKVFDYVKQEEFIVPCTTFPFNEFILSAVMAQNSQERHASYYGGNGKVFAEVEELIPDLSSMKTILENNGFYRDLKEWQKTK